MKEAVVLLIVISMVFSTIVVVQGFDHDCCFQLTTKGVISIDVEKYVWDPINKEWNDADKEGIAANLRMGTVATFKIVIHNDGEENLTNINVKDKMHDSLEFKAADPEPDHYNYEQPYWYFEWFFPGPLNPCQVIEIYITATVLGPEESHDFNYVNVTAADPQVVNDDDYAWVCAIKKPRDINIQFLNFIQRFIQQHPVLFLMLRYLLKLQ